MTVARTRLRRLLAAALRRPPPDPGHRLPESEARAAVRRAMVAERAAESRAPRPLP